MSFLIKLAKFIQIQSDFSTQKMLHFSTWKQLKLTFYDKRLQSIYEAWKIYPMSYFIMSFVNNNQMIYQCVVFDKYSGNKYCNYTIFSSQILINNCGTIFEAHWLPFKEHFHNDDFPFNFQLTKIKIDASK